MPSSDHFGSLSSTAGESDRSYQLLPYGPGGLEVNAYPKSPYTDLDLVTLEVGPNKVKYCVHRPLLAQSPELDAKPSLKLWGDKKDSSIALPDLDEDTAHTLIHYLYTGRYQALEQSKAEDNGSIAAYRLGTCVYCAATKYKLGGLAQLARAKINALAEQLPIMDVLKIARENVFPGQQDEESWFISHLDDAIKAAHANDLDLFQRKEFAALMQGGDVKFIQVLINAMVTATKGSTGRASTGVGDQQTGLSTPITEPKHVRDMEEPKLDGLHEKEEADLQRVDSPMEAPAPPEPATDELGYGSSTTYQKMGGKTDKAIEPLEGSEAMVQESSPAPIKTERKNLRASIPLTSVKAPILETTTARPELASVTKEQEQPLPEPKHDAELSTVEYSANETPSNKEITVEKSTDQVDPKLNGATVTEETKQNGTAPIDEVKAKPVEDTKANGTATKKKKKKGKKNSVPVIETTA